VEKIARPQFSPRLIKSVTTRFAAYAKCSKRQYRKIIQSLFPPLKIIEAFCFANFGHHADTIPNAYHYHDSVAGGRQSRSPSTSQPVSLLVLRQDPLRRGVLMDTCRPMETPSGSRSA
jgi:hypothetical protein